MHLSPVLAMHIAGGTLGLFSGSAAIALRKGSRRHGIAGDVFVVSMMVLGLSGAYLGALKHEPGNVVGGVITSYLVATAWLTARRRVPQIGVVDWLALPIPLTVGVFQAVYGYQALTSPTGLKFGLPVWPYAMMFTVALLAATGDIRMLVHGGISGTQRLVRHLWRMCFALFVASGSIFLARAHLFPLWMRKSGTLVALTIFPIALMLFWLVWVRVSKRYKGWGRGVPNRKQPVLVSSNLELALKR